MDSVGSERIYASDIKVNSSDYDSFLIVHKRGELAPSRVNEFPHHSKARAENWIAQSRQISQKNVTLV